jgi:chorismate mutase
MVMPTKTKDDNNINARRAEIDRLDDELLRLLNKRAELGSKLLALKRSAGLPICDPNRELEVLCRARESNPGPLDGRAVENIFRRIIAETRRAEERENQRLVRDGVVPVR